MARPDQEAAVPALSHKQLLRLIAGSDMRVKPPAREQSYKIRTGYVPSHLATRAISLTRFRSLVTRPNQPQRALIAFSNTQTSVIDPRCDWLGLACETNASLPFSGHIL